MTMPGLIPDEARITDRAALSIGFENVHGNVDRKIDFLSAW